jgi:hypothetical protein
MRDRASSLTSIADPASVQCAFPHTLTEWTVMELTQIAGGDCGRDDCPTIFTTDRGTLVVQGYIVNRTTPDGEAVVEIPLSVFEDAARALGR